MACGLSLVCNYFPISLRFVSRIEASWRDCVRIGHAVRASQECDEDVSANSVEPMPQNKRQTGRHQQYPAAQHTVRNALKYGVPDYLAVEAQNDCGSSMVYSNASCKMKLMLLQAVVCDVLVIWCVAHCYCRSSVTSVHTYLAFV